jgi:hypothetical protein
MNYTPADFFVSIVDFFGIILPGALLAYLFLDKALDFAISNKIPLVHDAAQTVLFVFVSFLLGYFLSILGSALEFLLLGRRLEFQPLRDQIEGYFGKNTTDKSCLPAFYWADAFIRSQNPTDAIELDRLQAMTRFFRSLPIVSIVWFFLNRCTVLPFILLGLSLALFWHQHSRRQKTAYVYFIITSRSRTTC